MAPTGPPGDNELMEEPVDGDPAPTGARPYASPPAGAPVPPTAPTPERRLRRSRNGEIGGVATGLATYLGVEPLFFRIGFIILTLFSGFGLVLYAAGWLLIPAEDDPETRPLAVTSNVPALVGGFMVLALGSLVAANGVDLGANILIPLVMILFGVWVLNQRRDPVPPPLAAAAPPPPPAPPVRPYEAPEPFIADQPFVADEPSVVDQPVIADRPRDEGGVGADYEWSVDPVSSPADPASVRPIPPAPPIAPRHWAHTRPDGPPPRTGPPITSITLAASVVVVGALLVLRNLGGVDVDATVILGAVASLLGCGLIASSLYGRALALFPLAFLVLPLLAIAPLIDTTLGGGIGSRTFEVSGSADNLADSYRIGAGNLRLDLRDLELSTDETVEVEVGAGYAKIIVPTNVRVEVEATNRAGYVDAFGVFEEGLFNDLTSVSEGEAGRNGSLTIIANVTFGFVEVRRG